jgi:prepilin-type N-terminal cleavage/methylation domain-containing protein
MQRNCKTSEAMGRAAWLCVPARKAKQLQEAGMSLLEVLIAVSLLGISFVSIFTGLSAGLRATGRLDLFDRADEFAIQQLNELFLDPSLQADDRRFGTTPSGISWEATTELVEKRPLAGSDKPAQLARIKLQVSWSTPKGRQTLNLETLKLIIPEPPQTPSGP